MEYWQECISEAFEDAGITATRQQIATVAEWVESAHEGHGMAHGHDCIPNPLVTAIEKIKRDRTAETDRLEARARKSNKEWADECRRLRGVIDDLRYDLDQARERG